MSRYEYKYSYSWIVTLCNYCYPPVYSPRNENNLTPLYLLNCFSFKSHNPKSHIWRSLMLINITQLDSILLKIIMKLKKLHGRKITSQKLSFAFPSPRACTHTRAHTHSQQFPLICNELCAPSKLLLLLLS